MADWRNTHRRKRGHRKDAPKVKTVPGWPEWCGLVGGNPYIRSTKLVETILEDRGVPDAKAKTIMTDTFLRRFGFKHLAALKAMRALEPCTQAWFNVAYLSAVKIVAELLSGGGRPS